MAGSCRNWKMEVCSRCLYILLQTTPTSSSYNGYWREGSPKGGRLGQKLWWTQMCLGMFSECMPCFFFLIRKLNLKFKWRLKNKNKKDPHLILVEKYPKLRKTCRRILKVLNILKNIPENLNSSPGIRKETSEKCPLPNLIFKFGKLPKNGKTFGG